MSVIMPCFNHARFLERSVAGILEQSYADLELIVVDDCSSDNSWVIAQRLAAGDQRVRAMRHERNLGASRSRNDGLRVAHGQYLGFCDADDIWEPAKLAIQIRLLEQHLEFDVVYCDATIINENGADVGERFSQRARLPTSPSGYLFPELLIRNFINMQSVVMRRKCWERVGSFDEGIKWVEDWWYWVKVSRNHRFLYHPGALARYRVHSQSTKLTQKRGVRWNRYKVFKRMLDQFPDLPRAAKADILYQMGVDLYCLGWRWAGRQRCCQALRMAIGDLGALRVCSRALARMILVPGPNHT